MPFVLAKIQAISKIASAVRMIGAAFICCGIRGTGEAGALSQLRAAPPIIAPRARLVEGLMKNSPFSNEKLGAGWLDKYTKEKNLSRAEYITVRAVARSKNITIIKLIWIEKEHSIIISLE